MSQMGLQGLPVRSVAMCELSRGMEGPKAQCLWRELRVQAGGAGQSLSGAGGTWRAAEDGMQEEVGGKGGWGCLMEEGRHPEGESASPSVQGRTQVLLRAESWSHASS